MAARPELKRYKDKTIYPTTRDIKSQLRDIVADHYCKPISTNYVTPINRTNKARVVVTERAAGKTAALVQFIGERILTTDKDIAVACCNNNIAERFRDEFVTTFPTLPEPYIFAASGFDKLHGRKTDELYVEEIFLVDRRDLRELAGCAPLLVGVGSIVQPTSITISL